MTRETFEKLLLKTIDFFGSAMNDSIETSSLLILADKYEARNEIFEEIERLYNFRSEFVHKGINNISEIEISTLSYIAFSIIIRLLPWAGKIKTLNELIESLNEIKFSGPSFSVL